MSKKSKIIIFCLVLSVIIAVVPLTMIHNSEFGGADDAAEGVIEVANPNYKVWAHPILEPPGPETESLLFCLQAAAGSGAFFFFMGYLVARKKFGADKDKKEK